MDKTKRKYLSDLHFEHQLWNMEMNFYADELKVYQHWLSEIADKNTHEEVLKQVEHFQNQFIIQEAQMHTLKNDINAHESWLANYAEDNPVAVDHKYFADHTELRENVATFINLYKGLKMDFKGFVEKWM